MSRSRDESLIAAFGAVLADLRARRGLSQEALAHEADIDRTFVGRLESGKLQPTLSVIFTLARSLGVTPESLLKQTRDRVEV